MDPPGFAITLTFISLWALDAIVPVVVLTTNQVCQGMESKMPVRGDEKLVPSTAQHSTAVLPLEEHLIPPSIHPCIIIHHHHFLPLQPIIPGSQQALARE
jgi:hypothetical protein